MDIKSTPKKILNMNLKELHVSIIPYQMTLKYKEEARILDFSECNLEKIYVIAQIINACQVHLIIPTTNEEFHHALSELSGRTFTNFEYTNFGLSELRKLIMNIQNNTIPSIILFLPIVLSRFEISTPYK